MWVEKTDKRTQKSKTFYDADTNKYRAEFAIHDRHFKDETDNWIDVDENFEDDTGGFNKKCDKTRHAIYVTNGGARRWYPRRNVQTEYVDITNMQYYTNQWRNLNLPTPAWTNNKSEWDMANLYASITNTWRRIKTDFILKNNTAPTRLRFEVSFTGLTYNSTTGEITSTTDGLVWGYINKPTAKDANDANVVVTQTYDSTYIEWSINTTGATFPIDVDPTFTDGDGGNIQTSYDTYTNQDSVTTNYGTFSSFYSRDPDRSGGHSRAGLLRFNLSSISSSSNCTSVTLTFSFAFTGEALTTNIHEILSANSGWTENGATWNHAVEDTVEWAGGNNGCMVSGTDYSATVLGSQSIANWGDYGVHPYDFALTASAIKTWFGSPNSNYGIIVLANTEWFNVQIWSSDDDRPSVRPKLVVEYTEGGGGIIGSTSWGQSTGTQEGNVRTFSGNWTGNGFVSGSGNYEKMYLSSTAYMESEVVNTGANSIDLYQNKYSSGDTGVLKYRSGSSVADCQAAAWQTYSGSFTSSGYTQIRVEGS